MLIKEVLSCYILQKNRIGFLFLGGGLLKTFHINHQLLTQPYTTEQQGGSERSAVYIEVLIMELAAAG